MRIEIFFRHFLLTPVSHLPVIDEEKNLMGLLSKEKISREMADLSSEGLEYQKIPAHLLEDEINESILYYFQNFRTIPVLNLYSQRVDAWEKPRFLAEVSKLLESDRKEPEPEIEPESKEPNNKLLIYKFMELILRNFPDALYATDKDGNTTFYNEKFETTVLSRNIFRDSIGIAEKYFREVSRDLISEYFKSTEEEEIVNPNLPPLITYIRNLHLFIKLITLKADEKVIGFLYQFTDPKARSITQRGVPIFPVLEEAFEMSLPLSEIMKEVESAYILKSFKKNHENISHTASDLGIPRSTLQNRIKFLNLVDLMNRDPEVPIPRIRKENSEPPVKPKVNRNSSSSLLNRVETLRSTPPSPAVESNRSENKPESVPPKKEIVKDTKAKKEKPKTAATPKQKEKKQPKPAPKKDVPKKKKVLAKKTNNKSKKKVK